MSKLLRIKPMSMLSAEACEAGRTHAQALAQRSQPGHARHWSRYRRGHLYAYRPGRGSARRTGRCAQLCASPASPAPLPGCATRSSPPSFPSPARRTPTATPRWASWWRGSSAGTCAWNMHSARPPLPRVGRATSTACCSSSAFYIPPQLTATTGTPLVFYHEQMDAV